MEGLTSSIVIGIPNKLIDMFCSFWVLVVLKLILFAFYENWEFWIDCWVKVYLHTLHEVLDHQLHFMLQYFTYLALISNWVSQFSFSNVSPALDDYACYVMSIELNYNYSFLHVCNYSLWKSLKMIRSWVFCMRRNDLMYVGL